MSLTYGGMLLLLHANITLHKGHRYGLCGSNGVGKSTLMLSIAGGKSEGFPSKEELKTRFVEHDQGEDADRILSSKILNLRLPERNVSRRC